MDHNIEVTSHYGYRAVFVWQQTNKPTEDSRQWTQCAKIYMYGPQLCHCLSGMVWLLHEATANVMCFYAF